MATTGVWTWIRYDPPIRLEPEVNLGLWLTLLHARLCLGWQMCSCYLVCKPRVEMGTTGLDTPWVYTHQSHANVKVIWGFGLLC